MDYRWCNGVEVRRVVWLNHMEILACKQLTAEQMEAGPMIVEKQTVSEIRSHGAPTRGAGGLVL